MTEPSNRIYAADIYFWRQALVLFADCFHAVGVGFLLSFPSVLNPAILANNPEDISVTKDQASWISSIHGFVGIIGFCIIPSHMQKYGRKFAHIVLNSLIFIGFLMLALAENVATLYVARSVQGLAICGVYLTSIILAEYSSPRRRGCFITLKHSAVGFGSLLCHSSILICTWRQIAAIASVSHVLAIILTFPWPESPAYCAMKGRYEDCSRAFTYLFGDTPITRKELEDLISAHAERSELIKNQSETERKSLKICRKLVKKDFLMPFFIITLLTVIIDAGGRYYNLAYIVQIIKDITGNNSVAIYCSMGLDTLSIVACCTSSYIITKFARRTLLFVFGYFSVALMFTISIIVYLKANNIATELVWLTPSLILLNSFIFSLGVSPVCFTVSGEIFPLEHRGSGTTATGVIFTLLMAMTVKYTPIMMDKTGIEGTYGIYGLCLVVSFIILHFVLTETKDKTLQEIEDEMKGIKRDSTVPQRGRELLAITTVTVNATIETPLIQRMNPR